MAELKKAEELKRKKDLEDAKVNVKVADYFKTTFLIKIFFLLF